MTAPAAQPPYKGLPYRPTPPTTTLEAFEALDTEWRKLRDELLEAMRPAAESIFSAIDHMTNPRKETRTMTSYKLTDRDGDYLKIEESNDRTPEGYIFAERGVYVSREEAPAVALAILEASGWTTGPHGYAKAVEILKEGVEARKKREEALVALDKEALKLFNAATESHYREFPNDSVRDTWRRAARRAREVHAPKPEPKPTPAPKPEPKKEPGVRYALVRYRKPSNGATGYGILDREKELLAPFGFNFRAAREALKTPEFFSYEPSARYSFVLAN